MSIAGWWRFSPLGIGEPWYVLAAELPGKSNAGVEGQRVFCDFVHGNRLSFMPSPEEASHHTWGELLLMMNRDWDEGLRLFKLSVVRHPS